MKSLAPAELTRSELEIAQRIVLGQSQKEIAYATFRSIRTVETTMKNIYAKLEINKATELCVWWFGRTFNIAQEIADMRSKILTICLTAVMTCSLPIDNSDNPMRNRRRLRRRFNTEIVLITNSKNLIA